MIDLRLGGNDFDQSALPEFVFDFADLQVLRLHAGNFTGPVPATVSGLVNLRQLWLQDNALTGAVPDLSAASQLTVLRLTDNEFTGQVPAYLESLSELVDVRLGNNALTGVIPEFVGNMVQLELFACQGNQLTGGLPESITNLANLVVLDVAENPLGGGITESISNLATASKYFRLCCNLFVMVMIQELTLLLPTNTSTFSGTLFE